MCYAGDHGVSSDRHLFDELFAVKTIYARRNASFSLLSILEISMNLVGLDMPEALNQGTCGIYWFSGWIKIVMKRLINEVQQFVRAENKFALVTLGKYGSVAWDGGTSYHTISARCNGPRHDGCGRFVFGRISYYLFEDAQHPEITSAGNDSGLPRDYKNWGLLING